MNRLQTLVGKRFAGLYRVVDMLVLDFGKDVAILDPYDSANPLRSEFSLRFMCQWRFINEGEILLGSRDIYIPFDSHLEEDMDWEYDVIGRPDAQCSIFDVRCREVEHRLQGSTAVFASVNELGDLRIEFSNGTVFESFTPSSRADEFWRMVCFYSDREPEHLVIFDTCEKDAE